VKDVSLHLRRGEIVGLLGPNGAGKTTCFYMIMGLITADGGKVTMDGADVTTLPMYQRARLGAGYLPQENSIFRGMSVWDNVMAVAELTEDTRAKRRELTESLLEELQISRLARQNANSLSGGERRRVEIARALASRPHFMLLDEPFSGIDAQAEADIFQVLDVLREDQIAVLLATHNLAQAATHYDKLLMLNQGRMIAYGPPAEIYTPENLAATFGDRIMLWHEGKQYVMVADEPCHECEEREAL